MSLLTGRLFRFIITNNDTRLHLSSGLVEAKHYKSHPRDMGGWSRDACYPGGEHTLIIVNNLFLIYTSK